MSKHKDRRTLALGISNLTNGMELLGSMVVAGEVGVMTSVAGGLEETSDKPSSGLLMVISAR
jgi:hypothetical protein